MFELYREKGKKGLCYHVVAWSVRPFDEDVRFWAQGEPLVVIQHQQGSCYSMTEAKFWGQFEGVEDEDIPPAYRPKDTIAELSGLLKDAGLRPFFHAPECPASKGGDCTMSCSKRGQPEAK